MLPLNTLRPFLPHFRSIPALAQRLLLAGACFLLATATHAATITVNTSAEEVVTNGECSLREAIESANGLVRPDCTPDGGPDVIEFDIPGAGPHTIVLAASLPDITDELEIRGESQGSAACSESLAHSLEIAIDGQDMGTDGLRFVGVPGRVSGLVIQNFTNGVIGLNGSGLQIECNHIGTNFDGTVSESNQVGVFLGSWTGAEIGGVGVAHNVIAGNNTQVRINTSVDVGVRGNLIGLGGDGIAPPVGLIPTGGVTVGSSSSNVTIEENRIAGINQSAVNLQSVADSVVASNVFGLNFLDQPVANRNAVFIGEMTSGVFVSLNVITASEQDGVGASVDATDYSIWSNEIFDNGDLGIDVGPNVVGFEGPTPNDVPDVDGAQNYPILTSAVAQDGDLILTGFIETTPNSDVRFQLFVNTVCDPSGFGEAESFRGQGTISTDGAGFGDFQITLPDDGGASGDSWTMTATLDETSEISPCLAVTRPEDVPLHPAAVVFLALLLLSTGWRLLEPAR